MRSKSSAELQAQDSASRGARAAGPDLAFSPLDDVRLLDHRKRHLQPGHSCSLHPTSWSKLRRPGEGRRLRSRYHHFDPGSRGLHVRFRCADLDEAGWALASYRFVAGQGSVCDDPRNIEHYLPARYRRDPDATMVARDYGLDNTWFALIVPPLFNSLGVLFMRQTFQMMPGELFDAARVEGVKEWRIFLFVGLRWRPALAALFPSSSSCIAERLWPLLINSKPAMVAASPVALAA